ncbi:hypothetical protein BST50_04350 [Vibrio vulnificus]|nr:hypothetical protein BST49_20835 [Vibrio vulnificus]PAO42416.1 hypothetical protein BST50_04350 [Vibrio vulnificus]PAO47205.1 hypothetical protein BST53_06780 [Vibrio vulnificus]PAO50865.1 hypothetical protein BST54_05220 [Vibrio vulnificus]PAO59133.1 hypothetical protein BST57_08075 [Vibrio vulnificus]
MQVGERAAGQRHTLFTTTTYIYNNDRLTYRRTQGVIAGFLGVFIVNFNESLLDFQFSLMGEGAAMFAAFMELKNIVALILVCSGIYLVTVNKAQKTK